MKRMTLTLATCFLILLSATALAGEPFPDVNLNGTLTADQKAYLGITSDSFKISDIDADYLFVEAFSMYCPICQRDAPSVNAAYEAIQAIAGSDRIKFIGIATGNTPFEAAFYQKKYDVKFPLFHDEDFIIHKALNEIGTPSYYIVKKNGSSLETLFFKEGEMHGAQGLISTIRENTDLK